MNEIAPTPRVHVSVPCPACPDPHRPEASCPRCGGDGILLLRVAPEDAGLSPEELLRQNDSESSGGERASD